MKTDWKEYDEWLHELVTLATDGGIELGLDKYSYHTYFMRGWLPESVLQDIRESKNDN